eukprot:830743_1
MQTCLLKPSLRVFQSGIRTVIGGTAIGLALYYPPFKPTNNVSAGWTDSLSQKWQDVIRATGEYLQEMADHPPESVITEEAIKQGYTVDKEEYGEAAKAKWKEANMNYAIIGASGAGKSTFSNTFAGKTGIEEDACEDGVGEMTGLKAKIKWLYILPEMMGKDRDKGQIVFWDLPGWGTQKYEPKEYIKKLGLPRYRGIILITSTRFTSNDVAFYKSLYDVMSQLIPDGPTRKHVPVYIVRTKFDRDLSRALIKKAKLKYVDQEVNDSVSSDDNDKDPEVNDIVSDDDNEYKEFYNSVTKWLWPQPLLTNEEFMTCWTKTVDDIKDDMAKEFKGVFDKDHTTNKDQLFEKLYILSGDWDNRMLTLQQNNADSYTGFPGLLRRIMLDPVYSAKGWNAKKIETHAKKKCKRNLMMCSKDH